MEAAEFMDLDWKGKLVVTLAVLAVASIVIFIAALQFQVWRLAHPQAPWWTWLF